MAEGMGDIVGKTFGSAIPSVPKDQILMWVLIGLGILVFAVALAIFTYFMYIKLRYNKKIVLFRKVGTSIVPVIYDKGWLTRVGSAGDTWLKVRKTKKTLPRPRMQIAKNEYWFFEREDGEWINFTLQDFDKTMKQAGVYYVEEDMRLQRLGIQKNLQERFQKVSFWQKYGGMIMSLIFILVITVCLVVLFKEMAKNWEIGREMASAVRDMAVQVSNLRVETTSGMQPL